MSTRAKLREIILTLLLNGNGPAYLGIWHADTREPGKAALKQGSIKPDTIGLTPNSGWTGTGTGTGTGTIRVLTLYPDPRFPHQSLHLGEIRTETFEQVADPANLCSFEAGTCGPGRGARFPQKKSEAARESRPRRRVGDRPPILNQGRARTSAPHQPLPSAEHGDHSWTLSTSSNMESGRTVLLLRMHISPDLQQQPCPDEERDLAHGFT